MKNELQHLSLIYGIRIILLGLTIAYLWISIYTLSYTNSREAFFWIFSYEMIVEAIIGVLVIFFSGLAFRISLTKQILNKKNWIAAGIFWAIATILTTALIVSTVSFFNEGYKYLNIRNGISVNKFVKPFILISTFGLLVFIPLGISFAYLIKRKVFS